MMPATVLLLLTLPLAWGAATPMVSPGDAGAPVKPLPPGPLPPGIVWIEVNDLHCKTCAKKAARRLYATPGVLRVKADMAKDRLILTLQSKKRVDLAKLWAAVKVLNVKPQRLFVDRRQFDASNFEPSPSTAKANSRSQGHH